MGLRGRRADLVEPTTRAACWDLGHARTFPEPRGPAQALPFVRELHLHDNRGTGDDHLPLRAASGWARTALRDFGEARLVTVEHRTLADCLASRDAAEALLP